MRIEQTRRNLSHFCTKDDLDSFTALACGTEHAISPA